MIDIKNIFLSQRLKDQSIAGIQPLNMRTIQETLVLSQQSSFLYNPHGFNSSKNSEMEQRMSSLVPFAESIKQLAINYEKNVTPQEIMGRSVSYAQQLQQYFMPSHTATNIQSHISAFDAITEKGMQYISFDIEGLGGTDHLGVNRFDGITELAFTMGNIHNNQVNDALNKTEHFFFGVDEETYERLKIEIQQPGFATSSDRGKVLANRLAIMGHKDTQVKGNQIYNEADIGIATPTVKQMLDGLEVNYRAWQHNQRTKTADGLTDADRFIKRFESLTNREDVVLTGHNIDNYDLPKLGLKNIDVSKAKKLDTLTVLKEASRYLTTEEIFGVANDVQKGMIGKTSLTQENIIQRILGNQKKGLQAHTASVDSALHSMIIGHPIMQNAVNRLKQNDASPRNMGGLIPNQTLLLNKQSSYLDKNSMSFLSLPGQELNTGNGYSFFGKTVQDNSFAPGIIKKDALYVFGGTGTMQLNDTDRKALELINGDYAQKELHYMILKPYGLDDTIQGNGIIIQFFKSHKHLEEFANQAINMGDGVNLPVNPVARERAQRQLTNPSEEAMDYNKWINEKISQTRQDRSARKIRNHDYSDTQRLLDFIDGINEVAKQNSITETITGFDVKDMQFAARLANGERMNIGTGLEFINEKIGKNTKYNTIDNLIAMAPFAYKNQNVMRQVMTMVNKKYSDEEQRKYAYNNVMRQVVDQIRYATTDKLNLSIDDLNYVELPYSKLIQSPQAGKLISVTEDLSPRHLRVNLGSKNASYNLVSDLLNYRHGGAEKQFTSQNRDIQARAVLQDFARAAKIDIGDPMSYDKGDDIANAIIIKLHANKAQDAMYMIEKDTINQSIEKGITGIAETYASEGIDLDKTIGTILDGTPIVSTLKQRDHDELARDVVSRFSQKISATHFYDFGFQKKHADYMHHIYKQFQAEQTEFYSRMFKEFKHFDGLGMILDENNFALTYNNQVYDMRQYMPQLKIQEDMAYIKVGNMEVSLNGVMSYNKKNDIFSLGTNFGDSVSKAPISYKHSKEAISRGIINPAEAMLGMIKQVNSFVRESPDIKLKNRMNKTRQFDIDFNQVLRYIPRLVGQGSIQVTKGERKAMERFAASKELGILDILDEDVAGDATLALTLNKYLDQASALIFNTDAYEGNIIKTVARYASPYSGEKRVSEGYLSFAPDTDAFGGYGPGNRITRKQNNFMSFDIDTAKTNLGKLKNAPIINFDHGVTSHYGHRIGHSKLTDFAGLSKELSDQIVVNKLNISHANFKKLIETHYKKGAQQGFTDEQWKKINARMMQYDLNEDESVIDSRIVENVFWQQEELQKVRTYRNSDNDFVADNKFKEMHKTLQWSIYTDKNGKTKYRSGGQIERKRNDPLFKIHGYRNTESLTTASYDGYLKLGFHTGLENIMFTDEDINYLIQDMSEEDARTYLNGLDSYYYLERKNKEPYTKVIVGNTEKTKSRSVQFAVGELDTELQDLLPASLVGSNATFTELHARATRLGVSQNLIDRMEREHYAADIVRNEALGGNYGIVTSEDRLKHKGIDTHLRELFPSLRQVHMSDPSVSTYEAAERVRKDFSGLGFDFDIAKDGTMLFSDSIDDYTINLTGIREVVKEKYKTIDPELLEHKEIRNSKLVGTSGMINLGRTKEHEISIVSAPIERTDQYYEYTKKINQNRNNITAREMVLKEMRGEQIEIDQQQAWYQEYERIKNNMFKREDKVATKIKSLEANLNFNTQSSGYLDQLNASVFELNKITQSIKECEARAKEISAIVNNPNVHEDTRRRYVTLSRENAEELKQLKQLKETNLSNKSNLTTLYVDSLKQDTKNKRTNERMQALIQIEKLHHDGYLETQTRRIQNQIRGLERAERIFEQDRRDYSTAYKLKNKGVVIDELAFMKLRNKKLTKETFANIVSLAPDKALSELGITEENATSRPIFSKLVKNIVEGSMTDGANVLTPENAAEEIAKIYGTSEVGQGILGVYNNNKHKNINLDLVEARYALSRMDMALGFNNNSLQQDYLEKHGFRVVDIANYQKSIGYEADFLKQGDSVFGANLLLKVDDRTVAVPYMPHSVYGETVVQGQYESSIIGLQRAYAKMKEINQDVDPNAYDKAKDNVTKAIKAVEESVHMVTAKGGPVSDAVTKSRHDTGFLAKSASFTDKYDAPLNQAFYKGKAIEEWFDEGVFINAGFTSEEVFRDMGYFSNELKDELSKHEELFGKKINGSITDDDLREIYKKHGISGLSGRFPYIQEMSINAKQLYLDTELKGNTIKNFLAEQGGKQSDNDGDYEAFMALKVTGKDVFVAQATGQFDDATKEILGEFETAMGIDAIGMNKFRAQKMKVALEKQAQAKEIEKQAEVYDRMFFEGNLFAEQQKNPYFEKDFDLAQIRQKVNELEELSGGKLDYNKPNEVATFIDGLDIEDIDKTAYKEAVVKNLQVSGRDLASTAKAMKRAIGEVNLMMRDFDQATEALVNYGHISTLDQKGVAEMSYAIQQESITPKNAKTGDIDIESIRDFKEILKAAKYGETVNYKGASYSPQKALGVYLDSTVKPKYLERYGTMESFEYKAELEAEKARYAANNQMDEWADREVEMRTKFYDDSKTAMQKVLGFVATGQVNDVREYNKLFTRDASTVRYTNTPGSRRGRLTQDSKKNEFMALQDDIGIEYRENALDSMISPENHTFGRMLTDRDVVDEIASYSGARGRQQDNLLSNIGEHYKPTRTMAGIALAGIGAYLMMGAVGNSVTANTTNQAEQFQGDTLSDYGSDYSMQDNAQQTSSGYVVNVMARTDTANAQKIAGQFNQSIQNSVNANLTMTLNINESPLKQFQINKMIEDSIFNR